MTSAIAHFKFLSHFKDFAKAEVARNERVSNSIDWRRYAKTLEKEDACFFDQSKSLKYTTSMSLLQSKHLTSSRGFDRYVRTRSDEAKLHGSQDAHNGTASHVGYDQITDIWGSIASYSQQVPQDSLAQQSLQRMEHQIDRAVDSRLWRVSFPLRKFASKHGLTDQRTLTEENDHNQSLPSKFTFVYDSIWWDVLGPFRVIEKILMRLGWLKRPD
jgi:hypothetical protein